MCSRAATAESYWSSGRTYSDDLDHPKRPVRLEWDFAGFRDENLSGDQAAVTASVAPLWRSGDGGLTCFRGEAHPWRFDTRKDSGG